MKFLAASFVILLISTVLTLGIALAAHGLTMGWVLLIGGGLVFLGLFINYGCRGH